MKKKVGLKDIAKKAGVSAALVSYVLNGKKKDRINKKTAEKIKKVAKEMNYRPNQIAKSLKRNQTKTIGLIVADIANSFSSNMARIIEDEAKKSGYTVIFGSADEDQEKTQNLIDTLLSRQVEGFILAAPEDFEYQLNGLRKEEVPFVLIDRYFKDLEANYVIIDNYSTAYKGIRHLIENGFKRIGIINYKTNLLNLEERNRGYREALKEAGLPVVPDNIMQINEENLEEEIKDAIDSLFFRENPIDALFLSSSKVAIEGLAYLRKKHTNVPTELAVLCFDRSKAYELFPCEISYIQQPLEQMGKKAVKLLLKNIKDKTILENIILKTKLIVKNSTSKLTTK